MKIALICLMLFVVYIHRKGRYVLLFVSYFCEERVQIITFLVRFLSWIWKSSKNLISIAPNISTCIMQNWVTYNEMNYLACFLLYLDLRLAWKISFTVVIFEGPRARVPRLQTRKNIIEMYISFLIKYFYHALLKDD